MKRAFTLAEVLITLSIVGLISALTIPSAVKSYNNRIYAASLEKAYAQINDAAQSIILDEKAYVKTMDSNGNEVVPGIAATSLYDDSECADEKEGGVCRFLKKYFRYNNLCENEGNELCVAGSYASKSGVVRPGVAPCIYTNNGAGICMRKNDNNEIEVFIDINGASGPNILGVDAFGGYISSGASAVLKDYAEDGCGELHNFANVSKIVDSSAGCLHEVIKNGWTISD